MARLLSRFESDGLLGEGATGRVYAGIDLVDDSTVALKVCDPDQVPLEDLRREVVALRMLRIPGVVGIREAGPDEAGWVIAMDLARGEPFPGTGTDMLLAARSLAKGLAGVHRAGFVHGDLKPSNVLVDEGHATILDLGLARATRHGLAVSSGMTPEYAAPEQWLGGAVDSRADVYAAGVMLYEALAGRLPYDPTDPASRLRPVQVWPDAPSELLGVLEACLQVDPRARPTDGAQLAAMLGLDVGLSLPYLGSAVDDVLRLVEARGQVRVGGAAGGGRTRLLEELSRRLEVRYVASSSSPFGSLGLGDLAGSDFASVSREVTRHLSELGVVWLVDAGIEVDRWARGALLTAPRVVWADAAAADADVVLEPLSADDLEGWFEGPERLIRSRSRPATAVFERSGGNPRAATRLVATWIEDGLAVQAGSRVHLQPGRMPLADWIPEEGAPVPRDLEDVAGWIGVAPGDATLERIARWSRRPLWEIEAAVHELKALGRVRERDGYLWGIQLPRPPREVAREHHARIAAGLEPGTPSRMHHLLLAGEPEAFAEGLVEVRRALDERDPEGAWAVLHATRPLVPEEPPPEYWQLVLETAIRSDTRTAHDRALLTTSRAPPETRQLVDALLATWEGDPSRTLALTEALAPSWVRAAVRVDAALRLDLERAKVEVEEAAGFLGPGHPDPWTWRGYVSYRRLDFEDALTCHERAAEQTTAARGWVTAMCNAAAAALELFRFERVLGIVDQVCPTVARLDSVAGEARVEVLERVARYRAAEALEPDVELVEALAAARLFRLAPLAALNEAAVAWRTGEVEVGRKLALEAVGGFEALKSVDGAALAEALAVRCGHTRSSSPRLPEPRNRLLGQAHRLLGGASCRLPQVVALAGNASSRQHRFEVLSVRELICDDDL